jgi:xylulokinase
MNVVGLDLGTSAIKAVLVSDTGEVLASTAKPLTTESLRPSWSEQNPDDWWRQSLAALHDLRHAAPQAWREVVAIGLSGQMHAAVLIGGGEKAVRPAILWNDARAVQEAQELNETVPEIGVVAGVPATASFTAPKLLWLARHEPSALAEAHAILSAKDFLRLRLTGERASDMSDASGTSWLDVAGRRWYEPLVEASGLKLDRLPRLCEGMEATGTVRPDIADLLGLEKSVVLAAGAGDVAAAALGLGVIDEGDGLISIGTSAQYLVAARAHRPAPGRMVHAYAHGLPQRWFQMAALLNGASCLAWASAVLGRPLDALLSELDSDFDGPSPLLFLPYLAGERTPHNDADAKGVLVGLTPSIGPADIVQSVLEGVAFALADGQESLASAGTHARTLAITGGGARSPVWLRIIASVLGRDLTVYPESGATAAIGAARLARLSVTREPPHDVCTPPEHGTLIPADPDLVPRYRERHQAFRELYLCLRDNFRHLASNCPS